MIKIAAYQGPCQDDFNANLAKVYEVIERAGREDTDFLCFPEGYLSNYGVELAVPLDDSRVHGLVEHTNSHDMVVIVGISERVSEAAFNTMLVLYRGEIIGTYRKTMLTGSDKRVFASDYALPVFEAKGICFGVIVCHDSSFVEPALVMRWKGARLLFSPHYNSISHDQMDEHRTLVRNNHVGLSVLLQMVVVRANVVGGNEKGLGYGDSAIFSPLGVPVAEAPLFKEALISAEFPAATFTDERWRTRREIPLEVYRELWGVASGESNDTAS